MQPQGQKGGHHGYNLDAALFDYHNMGVEFFLFALMPILAVLRFSPLLTKI